jgi:hypothetical protein
MIQFVYENKNPAGFTIVLEAKAVNDTTAKLNVMRETA